MAESVALGDEPFEPVMTGPISRALEHLRPFPPIPDSTGHRGAEQPTDPTSSTAQAQQNGSAHVHYSNGVIDTNIPPLATVIERIHARVHAFLSESHPSGSLLASAQKQTRISLDVVSKALSQYKLSELSLSYNGGKDCLVLLILFLAGLHPYSQHAHTDHKTTTQTTTGPATEEVIPSIYALPPDPFPSVEEFVVSSAQAYHLSITKYTTSPPHTTIRTVFEDYLQRHPGIRAIFVGTRRTDPHGAKLTHFDRTDHGWPDFMRVHPVIDWHYAEIWAFIRHLDLEFCDLYRQGYTSLGGTSDTKPNPKLRRPQEDGGDGEYLPAYELTQDVEERLGRN
ncbi:FAD synthetase [Penicillium cinerascens]|uniref:FAD synthase n=1 Tax=Penicillium cinerascens TaxID=70096 RepID=A0A9W9JCL2_9EURO|nr:FAD synthetase [Penicillium cinerascens]KAJ5194579.1 FAD synthetase [Penicillium cinerascens]